MESFSKEGGNEMSFCIGGYPNQNSGIGNEGIPVVSPDSGQQTKNTALFLRGSSGYDGLRDSFVEGVREGSSFMREDTPGSKSKAKRHSAKKKGSLKRGENPHQSLIVKGASPSTSHAAANEDTMKRVTHGGAAPMLGSKGAAGSTHLES